MAAAGLTGYHLPKIESSQGPSLFQWSRREEGGQRPPLPVASCLAGHRSSMLGSFGHSREGFRDPASLFQVFHDLEEIHPSHIPQRLSHLPRNRPPPPPPLPSQTHILLEPGGGVELQVQSDSAHVGHFYTIS
uniref:Uncharacterized protein n=1 Tax=Takifugu rubripes TaxID=31033 RepID=A0A674N2R0_TAKRU